MSNDYVRKTGAQTPVPVRSGDEVSKQRVSWYIPEPLIAEVHTEDRKESHVATDALRDYFDTGKEERLVELLEDAIAAATTPETRQTLEEAEQAVMSNKVVL